MNTTIIRNITEESFPKIRAIIKERKCQSSTVSLAAWGAINLGAWFFLGQEDREFLRNLHSTNNGIYFILYGGAFLGSLMLFLATLGAVARFSGIILLDGALLIALGLLNISYDFIAEAVLRPYGYTMENPNVIWIALGLSQIAWGARDIFFSMRVNSWHIPEYDHNDLVDFKKHLRSFVLLAENPKEGIIKGSIDTNDIIPSLSGLGRTEYTGRLFRDTVIMISVDLSDCFRIRKQDLSEESFGYKFTLNDVYFILHVRAEHTRKDMEFSPLSAITLKTWCGTPVQAKDIEFAAAKNAFTIESLKPFLFSDDPELLSAAVSAISSITDPSASALALNYIENPNPGVQAASLRACADLKIPDLISKSITLLSHSDERVRAAAAQYLSVFPDISALSPLRKALTSETKKEAKKHIKRALRSVEKNS